MSSLAVEEHTAAENVGAPGVATDDAEETCIVSYAVDDPNDLSTLWVSVRDLNGSYWDPYCRSDEYVSLLTKEDIVQLEGLDKLINGDFSRENLRDAYHRQLG